MSSEARRFVMALNTHTCGPGARGIGRCLRKCGVVTGLAHLNQPGKPGEAPQCEPQSGGCRCSAPRSALLTWPRIARLWFALHSPPCWVQFTFLLTLKLPSSCLCLESFPGSHADPRWRPQGHLLQRLPGAVRHPRASLS